MLLELREEMFNENHLEIRISQCLLEIHYIFAVFLQKLFKKI